MTVFRLLKKTSISVLLLSICAALFTSCFESVSESSKHQKEFYINGEVEVEGAVPRSAIPSYDSDNLFYKFVAVEKDSAYENLESTSTDGTFSLVLKAGKWRITCSVYACKTKDQASESNKILEGTYPETSEPEMILSEGEYYKKEILFVVKPFVSAGGKGSAKLPVKVEEDSGIKSCVVKWKESGTQKTQVIDFSSSSYEAVFNFNGQDVPAGYYTVSLTFYDGPVVDGNPTGQVVCVTHQVVNVFNSLETDYWKPDTSNTFLSGSAGSAVFTIKKEHVEILNRQDFYVDGSASDGEGSEYGTQNSPFNTVQKALAYIKKYGLGSAVVHVKRGSVTKETSSLEVDSTMESLTLNAYGDESLSDPVISAEANNLIYLFKNDNSDSTVNVSNICFKGNETTVTIIGCLSGDNYLKNIEVLGNNAEIGLKIKKSVHFSESLKVSGCQVFGITTEMPVTIKDAQIINNTCGIHLGSSDAQLSMKGGVISTTESDGISIDVYEAVSDAVVLSGKVSILNKINLTHTELNPLRIKISDGFETDSKIQLYNSGFYFSQGGKVLSGDETDVSVAFKNFEVDEKWQIGPDGCTYKIADNIIYVSKEYPVAASLMDGTYLKPYKNFNDVVTHIKSYNYTDFTVYVASDISASNDNFYNMDPETVVEGNLIKTDVSPVNTFCNFNFSSLARKISVDIKPIKEDKKYTVDLNRSKDNPGRLFKLKGNSVDNYVFVTVSGLKFTGGYLSDNYCGSGVFAGENSTIAFDNCEFDNFSVEDGYGFMCPYRTGYIDVQNCKISNIKAKRSGSVVRFFNGGHAEFINTELENCGYEDLPEFQKSPQFGVYEMGELSLSKIKAETISMTSGNVYIYDDVYVEKYELNKSINFITVKTPHSQEDISRIYCPYSLTEGTCIFKAFDDVTFDNDFVQKFIIVDADNTESQLFKLAVDPSDNTKAVIAGKNSSSAGGSIQNSVENRIVFTTDSELDNLIYGQAHQIKIKAEVSAVDGASLKNFWAKVRCSGVEISGASGGAGGYWSQGEIQDGIIPINISGNLVPGTYYLTVYGSIGLPSGGSSDDMVFDSTFRFTIISND